MFERMLDEILTCLDGGCYIAALNTALTLPDICGKVEYPGHKNKVRYIMWYDKYIGRFEISPGQNLEEFFPNLVGEVVYNLRNSLTHEGNATVNLKTTKIHKFILLIEKSNNFNLHVDNASKTEIMNPTKDEIEKGHIEFSYSVNVQRFCRIMHDTAKIYYEDNKDKFDFSSTEIFDLDKAYDFLRNNR